MLIFRRESRLLDCGDFLLPSLVPGLDLGLGQGGGGSVILLFCYMSGFSAKIKR